MVFFFSEKLSPVDRNRIRDRPLVLISMRWHNKPNAYSCLTRNALHIPKLVLCHFAPCMVFRTRGTTKSPYILSAESISNKIIVGIEREKNRFHSLFCMQSLQVAFVLVSSIVSRTFLCQSRTHSSPLLNQIMLYNHYIPSGKIEFTIFHWPFHFIFSLLIRSRARIDHHFGKLDR